MTKGINSKRLVNINEKFINPENIFFRFLLVMQAFGGSLQPMRCVSLLTKILLVFFLTKIILVFFLTKNIFVSLLTKTIFVSFVETILFPFNKDYFFPFNKYLFCLPFNRNYFCSPFIKVSFFFLTKISFVSLLTKVMFI